MMDSIKIAKAIKDSRKHNRKLIFVIPGGDADKSRLEAQKMYPAHELIVLHFMSPDGATLDDKWLNKPEWYTEHE